jgi:hypothetical protein
MSSHLKDCKDCFYKLSHGIRPKLIANLNVVGTSIVKMNKNIVNDILCIKASWMLYTSICLQVNTSNLQ